MKDSVRTDQVRVDKGSMLARLLTAHSAANAQTLREHAEFLRAEIASDGSDNDEVGIFVIRALLKRFAEDMDKAADTLAQVNEIFRIK